MYDIDVGDGPFGRALPHADGDVGQQAGRSRTARACAQLAHQLANRFLRQRGGELPGGGVLQVMGLIDDQVAVLRKSSAFNGHVGEQQRVVDDDEMSAVGSFAGGEEEAAVAILAFHVETGIGGGVELGPDGALTWIGQEQLALVAGDRGGQPGQGLRQDGQLGGRQVADGGGRRPAGAGTGSCHDLSAAPRGPGMGRSVAGRGRPC